MLIFGHGLFGRCDYVRGRFHVATRFFTIFFLPIVPLEGYLVLSENGSQFQGIKIPISIKSLLLAWSRAALWGPGIVLLLLGFYNLYCLMAGEVGAKNELLKNFGGSALFITLGIGSMFFGVKANFRRAIQLGMAAGVSPAQIAADYGQPLPDDATLARLASDIRPTAEESDTSLGPVGRFFAFLVSAIIGIIMFGNGGLHLLREGYRGWTASLWACLAGIGAALIAFGVSRLFRKRNKRALRVVYGIVGVATLVAIAAGPWLSKAWWRSEEDRAWQTYLTEIESSVKADQPYRYGTITTAPYALHRTEFFLLALLASGERHFSQHDPLTQSWHRGDARLQVVDRLADEMAADTQMAGPAKWDNRRELLKKYLPIVKSGGWPEDLK